MILSDREIKRRIEEGSLVVEPFTEEDLSPNGIDFRLGEEIADLGNNERYSTDREVVLKPNSSYLAITLQKVEMPLNLIAIVTLKSTWARAGCYISTTVIDAGYRGRLTLAFHTGPKEVKVKKGTKIWHLIFIECYPSSGYKGKYQGLETLAFADFSRIA